MGKRVFISYAKDDIEFAKRLYADLQKAGVDPWLDRFDLIPGQLWDKAIREAISQCSYFVAVLSSRSVTKKGYVQKEVRQALEIADGYPEGMLFILPVRLDDCEPSFDGLRRLHRADLFPDYDIGLKDLLRVFTYATEEKPKLTKAALPPGKGTIKTLTDRGFGFISIESRIKDLFFHHAELVGITFDELRVGDVVTFEWTEGPKGPAAQTVSRA